MATDTPAMVVFPIPKDWITSDDVASAVGILSGLISNAQSTQLYAGKLALSFDGWDNDVRALFEIPEVYSWFIKLDRAFPHWFVLANRTTGTIPLIYNLVLAPGTRVPDGMGGFGVRHPRSQINALTNRYFTEMHNLASRLGIEPAIVQGWTKDVTECLRADFD